jgi:decaprenylphospho-beta-D-erythro-pentofuranosid-2-ulose 2-reductase
MKLLIIGATSAIANETAKLYARDGAELFLVGRSPAKLAAVKDDLLVRGAKRVETYVLDLSDLEKHTAMIEAAIASLGELNMVLVAHGSLPDPKLTQQNVAKAIEEFTTNCTSVISLLTILANYFEQRRHGTIAVISSVAGDRGRKSNYLYGAAKGAVTIFLQGLRGRLASSGVKVITIKPGFVDTPMTAHVRKGLLFTSPRTAGKGIYHAMNKGKEVVYLPWFWRPIMLIVKSVPERVFKRVSI